MIQVSVTPVTIAFAVLLVAAAVIDFSEQRIPNWIVLAVSALFLLQAARHAADVSWVAQLGAGTLAIAVGLGLFMLGHLGAGDAKMFAAVSLWTGFAALMPMLLLTSITGLVFASILVLLRKYPPWQVWDPNGKRPKSLVAGGGVPYGVAIAGGALLSLGWFPAWLWR